MFISIITLANRRKPSDCAVKIELVKSNVKLKAADRRKLKLDVRSMVCFSA